MGKSSVLSCGHVRGDVDGIVASVRPNNADGNVYNITARTLSRYEGYHTVPTSLALSDGERGALADALKLAGDEQVLYTTETIRQRVVPDNNDLRAMPLIKEIETTTVFLHEHTTNTNSFKTLQRTCTYLPKSDLRYPDARGRPVDVRWYFVEYTRMGT